MGISRAIKNYEMESDSPASFAGELLGEVDGVEGAGFEDFGEGFSEGFGEFGGPSLVDTFKNFLGSNMGKVLAIAAAGFGYWYLKKEKYL